MYWIITSDLVRSGPMPPASSKTVSDPSSGAMARIGELLTNQASAVGMGRKRVSISNRVARS